MRNRTLHTSVNLLVEPELYQRLKMSARLERTPMSKIIRNGIRSELDKMDRENPNAIIIEENHDHLSGNQ
jgi:hypothetical protein